MKKITTLLFATILLCGVAYALDGLTVGAEYRVRDFDADEVSEVMDVRLNVAYEGAFMEEALEIEAEVGFGMQNFDDMRNGLDVELQARYYFDVSAISTMSFILNSKTSIPFDDEKGYHGIAGFSNKPISWLKPGVHHGHELSFGKINIQIDVPLLLVHDTMDAFDIVGIDFILSLNERKGRGLYQRGNVSGFANGFGAEFKMESIITDPSDSDFAQRLEITPFFGHNLLYAEVEVGLPLYEDGFDLEGMTIKPKFEMDIPPVNGLSMYLDMPISNIGADVGDPVFGVGFGVNFNF
ncbi:MAG: hypothetical protein FWG98_10350 [Candidatus Cloacimonetes bacterium]|nr:hypothetical protein [Candidatus Cloacimonadota bacterium]